MTGLAPVSLRGTAMAEQPGAAPRVRQTKPGRIETQIPRRKKGRAVPPLKAEWEPGSDAISSGLRMPASNMKTDRT
ncbi:hypothetical protein DNFV4_00407 [Nitrospira tepida]|uniref:Uncharacterized protein n=1 Tax=Nitrospira tepida TaxID=2973512 RepID=A0AA86MVW0_9BACT|nr:hypothetical protein DNFV4_00407 [Nitrospira tepida]